MPKRAQSWFSGIFLGQVDVLMFSCFGMHVALSSPLCIRFGSKATQLNSQLNSHFKHIIINPKEKKARNVNFDNKSAL